MYEVQKVTKPSFDWLARSTKLGPWRPFLPSADHCPTLHPRSRASQDSAKKYSLQVLVFSYFSL